MKKIMFLVVVLLSTQIVNSQTTVMDATLIKKGGQNVASTISWLQSSNPDPSIIHMSVASFNREFFRLIKMMNDKYGGFTEITSDVINNEILPKLYSAQLENRNYLLSRYDTRTASWNSFSRYPKWINGEIEEGIFYQGWPEPLIVVNCWNFSYPILAAKQQVEHQYRPGKKIIIENGADTTIINNSDVVIENNKRVVSKTTQTLDTTESEVEEEVPVKKVKKVKSCNCDVVEDDAPIVKKKVRKPFFRTVGGEIVKDVLIFGAGMGTMAIINNNSGHSTPVGVRPTRVITQGPLSPLPTNTTIITQGPVIEIP